MFTKEQSVALRQALGTFTTGVTVVTTMASMRPVGLTVNSFNAVSLDPPLVLWSLQRRSPSLDAFVSAGRFAINVLAESQLTQSRTFADPRIEDKFLGIELDETASGLPLLSDALAHFECNTESHCTVGDHELFIGRVQRFVMGLQEPPLVFCRGSYRSLFQEELVARI